MARDAQGDVRFEAPERRTEAMVDPRAEREMAIRVACDVELLGAFEVTGVSPRRTEEEQDLAPLRDPHPVQLEVLHGVTEEALIRCVEYTPESVGAPR